MILRTLIVATVLLAGAARAQDFAPSYSVPGFRGRVEAVVTLCPSSDGSNSTVVCGTGGTGSSVTITGALPAGTNAIGTVIAKNPIGTPTAGLAHAVVTANTAVTVFSSGTIVNGAYITNPVSATTPLFVNPVTTATVPATGTTDGTTIELAPGQTFTTGPTIVAITANAATAGHSFVAVRY